MHSFPVFFRSCLYKKTNSLLLVFNFGMLLFIQVLMYAIRASIEDAIDYFPFITWF